MTDSKEVNQIICNSTNPFDTESLTPGNAQQEPYNPALSVDSMHQDALEEINQQLSQIVEDKRHASRSLIVSGDSGCGKSYLLARFKNTFDQKAFFVDIEPWSDSDKIWRHILRQIIDILGQETEGQEESNMLFWLNNLAIFRTGDFPNWITEQRGEFIRNLMAKYPVAIHNARDFFGVIYDLKNPDLYPVALSWLRGENLDEKDLKTIQANEVIDTEEAAKGILGNLGLMAENTPPIILCFDQLEKLPSFSNGFLDLQPLFDVNSFIHNRGLTNFFVIISIIHTTFNRHKLRFEDADLARINHKITLKNINLEQVQELWSLRLVQLHREIDYQGKSPLYPLTKKELKASFPGGKTLPRTAVAVGRNLFQDYQQKTLESISPKLPEQKLEENPEIIAKFNLLWQENFKEVKKKITKVSLLSSPELIKILVETLNALEVQKVKTHLLERRYGAYSLTYRKRNSNRTIGLVWVEEPNMATFLHVIKGIEDIIKQNICFGFYLLRVDSVGRLKNTGYKIYRRIFENAKSPHIKHIKPSLNSIHALATYHELIVLVEKNELVLEDNVITLEELQGITRAAKVFDNCRLLQDLGVVDVNEEISNRASVELQAFVLKKVAREEILGKKILIEYCLKNCPHEVSEEQIHQAIYELCQDQKIQILNPKASLRGQVIGVVPPNRNQDKLET